MRTVFSLARARASWARPPTASARRPFMSWSGPPGITRLSFSLRLTSATNDFSGTSCALAESCSVAYPRPPGDIPQSRSDLLAIFDSVSLRSRSRARNCSAHVSNALEQEQVSPTQRQLISSSFRHAHPVLADQLVHLPVADHRASPAPVAQAVAGLLGAVRLRPEVLGARGPEQELERHGPVLGQVPKILKHLLAHPDGDPGVG